MGAATRRSFVSCGIAAAVLPALPLWATTPAPSRIPRIGFLNGSSFPTMTAAFIEELRRLGYEDGKNIRVETRLSRPNSPDLEGFVAEFATLDLDLVVAAALPIALVVRRLLPNVPMVVGTAAGLVSNGFAQSLKRPGGNVTGMDELPSGLTATRLRLLKEAAPDVSRVALLSTTPGRGGHEIQLADAQKAAAKLGITVKSYRAANLAEVRTALEAIGRDGMNGLLNFQGAVSLVNRELIIDFAAKHRIPAIYQSKLFAEAGGLMSYAPDQDEQFRVAARYVDKILRGAKAGDLPIQHPARYFLTINRSSARSLGLALPSGLLRKADFILS